MKNKSVIVFLIMVLIMPAVLFAASDEDELILFLPGAEAQDEALRPKVVTDDYSFLNGYDKISRTVKASGYGETVSSALADSHSRLLSEIEGQLIYRMNRFTSSTLTDMVDYVRYYAVNRNKIISMIASRAETKKIEQMRYGFIVTREVSRSDFDEIFKKFISSATDQMGIIPDTAKIAEEQMNKLLGVFEDKDPVVFSFANGKLIK